MKVELSGEADGQVEAIDAWWREHRPSAPGLFTDELDQALSDLAATPSLGTIYQAGSQTVRRLLLRRCHYHLYLIEEQDRIYVVAVWNAFGGKGPVLPAGSASSPSR